MCFIQHPKKEGKLVCTCAYSGDTLNLFVALVSFRHPANLSGRIAPFCLLLVLMAELFSLTLKSYLAKNKS